MLSSTCKYALRAVIYLAFQEQLNSEKEMIGIKKIARDLEIPMPFLSKILQTLSRHKILSSTKGPNGGFCLGRPASELFLMDVVEIVDGTDYFKKCVIGINYCAEQDNPCAMHSKYAQYRDKLKHLFENETIENLVRDVKKGKQKVNI
jgi:Rrf2 family transcriptional regulator, iron-sulfur cluster assembly transcription factor